MNLLRLRSLARARPVCEDGKCHGAELTCGHCSQSHVVLGDSALAADTHAKQIGVDMTDDEIRRRLYLLHSSTGHGPLRHLVSALKRRGVSPRVLELAEAFECPVCLERVKPQPRPVSSLEHQPAKFATLSADVGHWYHPTTHEKWQFLLLVDEGSRFRVARMLHQGKKQHISAGQFISVLRESWTEYFGHPKTLRLDPDGAFRSRELEEFCDQQNIMLDIIPGEAHWKLGICERSIQSVKYLLEAVVADHPDVRAQDALSESIRVLNHRDVVRGYSPVQHVLGKAPDETGRFFSQVRGECPDLVNPQPQEEFAEQHRLRLAAEKAFLEWQNAERLQRATNSKHRPRLDFAPGELVYIWRKQLTGEDAHQNKYGNGRFVGPARILATEKKAAADGTLSRGSSVWLVRGRRLLKASVEQLRRASERETILTELYDLQSTPTWDFPRISESLGGNEYEDITEVPDDQEWLRAQDVQEEWQPTMRYTSKGAPGSRESRASQLRDRSRSPARGGVEPNIGFVEGAHWTDQLPESCFGTASPHSRMQEYAVSVEIEMPSTRNSSEKALKQLDAYLVSSMKRQAVEVNEKYLSPEDRELFRKAKQVEVQNFISAKAFELLPAELKVSRQDAVRMRWILTWKVKPDGSRKAKARAVLLGYMDPQYEHRSTTSPTTTRQTRQIQLQLAASLGWTTWKGDVTGAFLQSRPYPDLLACIPCPEILEAMNLPPDSMTRVKKACYGLVDAPLEWYRSICAFMKQLGLRRCWSDPCCWVYVVNGKLHGLVSGHVDDFLFSGLTGDKLWESVIASIKQEYKWSDWEENSFVQCGVQVDRLPDGSYGLSQKKYVDDLKHINIRGHRRHDRKLETDDFEKSALRTLLGGVSWHAQQVAPHFSAEVSLMLSEVNRSTIDTLVRANRLLDQVKNKRDHQLLLRPCPIEKLHLYAWADAASQNRPDGGSTQGIVIAAADKNLLEGTCGPVNFLAWHSSRITRVCTSPGSSESFAVVNAEDLLYFARFQLAEMLGHVINIRDPNCAVNLIGGCVITDSRNVYDKVSTEVVCAKGAERRVDLTIMRLKESQQVNHTKVRWVHSDAQLANSLTKGHELRQILMFYDMNHCWRIIDDPSMSSARKRRERGQAPLDSTNHTQQPAHSHIHHHLHTHEPHSDAKKEAVLFPGDRGA